MSFFDETNTAKAREILARYPRPKSAILPLAHLAQDQNGWLSPEAMEQIAELTETTPADVLGTFAPYGVLCLFGVRPELVLQARGINLLYQYWIHTDTIRRLGPLEEVLNTPSHHRVHHGSNRRYLDRNHRIRGVIVSPAVKAGPTAALSGRRR